ncbi:MAG: competence protein ComEC [Caulobacter sp.]|nr:competence protein ComEC [Caulobacter sp.]
MAFGLGAAGYLALRVEPPLWGVALLAGLAAAAAALAVRGPAPRALGIVLLLTTFAAAGLLAGKVRSDAVAAPILADDRALASVEGFVVDVVSPGGGRGAAADRPDGDRRPAAGRNA